MGQGRGRPTVEVPRLKPLSEQVVVIMGASSGIGRETALQMARRGARLVVAARAAEALDSLADAVKAEGGQADAVTADTSDIDDVQEVAYAAVERYGGFDTWVQAAAVAVYARFERTTPEEFRRVLDVNLMGNAHAALVALPHLRERAPISVTNILRASVNTVSLRRLTPSVLRPPRLRDRSEPSVSPPDPSVRSR